MAVLKTTITANRERAPEVYRLLCKDYPEVHCTLEHRSPFQLLIMTMLSAQCTDVRVNIVAKTLFKQYPGPEDFLAASLKDIETAIHSTGFYRNKAKNIMAACKSLMEEHGGAVPGTMAELVRLAGVGRKTANVVLGECFEMPGVVVDTHCGRLARRLGFTKRMEPVKVELDLMKIWPPTTWSLFSHRMVFHGRAVCTSRAPQCSQCSLRELCPFPLTREGKKIGR
jgi:endonuclease III